MRLCEYCNKSEATVHVTEIDHKDGVQQTRERHLCEVCAQGLELPHGGSTKKTMADIWKLLQVSATKMKRVPSVTCPECGMTLEEFRRRGRLGCPKDYEVFAEAIGALLERVQGAREHIGRLPGVDDAAVARLQRMAELKRELDTAVGEEAYEEAARLRDEIISLEAAVDCEE
jgi:protein arginine kinase activator